MDSWISVIEEIKSRERDVHLMLVIPQRRTVQEVNQNSTVLAIANDLFDEVYYKSVSDRWVLSDSLFDAANESRDGRIAQLIVYANSSIKNSCIHRALTWVVDLYDKMKSAKTSRKRVVDKQAFADVDAVLMDIHEEHKDYNSELMHAFRYIPKYSLQHGISIQSRNIKSIARNWDGYKNMHVYLYSNRERPYYKARYNMSDAIMHTVGVPRHDKAWIRRIIGCEKSIFSEKGHIVVASRPANNKYLPRERKIKAVQAIKRLSDDNPTRKLVVKLHPKERRDGIYEKILGRDEYGKRWIYSDAHAFTLGENALFAITLCSSSLISDMIVLGVPTIEVFDFRNIPNYDYSRELHDERGHPVKSFRYWGLVMGAYNYEELKQHADRIIRERSKVVNELKSRHDELFTVKCNANGIIANEILQGLKD